MDRGYRVFATARQLADVEMLRQHGLESLQLDLNDDVSIENAVKKVLSRTGGTLYALFNNGAYGLPGAVEDLSRQALRDQFETNLFGWHALTRLVLPVMHAQGYGRIIQNSSVLGLVVLPFRGAYNASKFALEGLSDTLRLELAGSNIFVCMIEPGPIRSRFRDNAHRAYKQYIDADNSRYKQHYASMEARLKKQGDAMPFTLPPEAVLKRVIHALESPRPKPHYYVTFPAYLFAGLRRILPGRWLDTILLRISGDGKR